MPGTEANVSRDTFDASKGNLSVRLQQGVPITDADWNELQDNAAWWNERARDVQTSFDVHASDGSYLPAVLPCKRPMEGTSPVPFVALDGWWPGSMRPYNFDAGLNDDFMVMWGPAVVHGLFVDDFDQRGTSGLYSDAAHRITTGTLTNVAGFVLTDSAKMLPDDGTTQGRLHLLGESAGVGNGTDAPCRVRFTSGAEVGNVYVIAAVNIGLDGVTVTGPWLAGGPAIGDTYDIIPNAYVAVNGVTVGVYLCVWVEDISSEEDHDLEEPTMLLEPSHRYRVRYWLRTLTADIAGTWPTRAQRPLMSDATPQGHSERVYWVWVGALASTTAPLVVAGHFGYSTAKEHPQTAIPDLDIAMPFMPAVAKQSYVLAGVKVLTAPSAAISVTTNAKLDGMPAFASINTEPPDATATSVRCWWDPGVPGRLWLTPNAVPTGTIRISWFVFGYGDLP